MTTAQTFCRLHTGPDSFTFRLHTWRNCSQPSSPLSEVNEPLPTQTKANHSSNALLCKDSKIPHHQYPLKAKRFTCPRFTPQSQF